MSRNRQLRLSALGGLSLCLLLVAVALLSSRTPVTWAADQPTPPALSQPTQTAPSTPTFDHPDRACRRCHQAIYDSYEGTPMARGSGDAADQLNLPATAERGFTHQPSGITYRIFTTHGQAVLSYQRNGSEQRPALNGEERLAYFIGSGLRGRTYLYQQDHLWFETPINWYGKQQIWDMAPAYEHTRSMPAPLPVDANCLHCHAGEVQTATGGARNRFPGAPFRAPGVGCAACHGDPSAHLSSAGRTRVGTGAILNPARLDPVRRDDICLQCHLEGDATVYLPGKSLATFTPGHTLSHSALYFVDSNRAQQGRRATSQYEALLRSACKRAAGDKLTCTTCHDPHSSPAPAERVAYFRSKCLACHTGAAIARLHHPEQQDCAVCHMPTRKTLDISHEQLTDHDIEAIPPQPSLLNAHLDAPNLVPVGVSQPGPRELGLAYAQLAQHGNRAAGQRALELLQRAERGGSDDYELHNQLGYLLQVLGSPPQGLGLGSSAAAAKEYEAALREHPQDTTAAANLAVLYARQGNSAAALTLLRQTYAEDPSQTAAGLNLAFLSCRLGHRAEALAILREALSFHPDSPEVSTFIATGVYNGQTCDLR